MKLSAAVLKAIRHGAVGGAFALAACTTRTASIERDPAAQLAPVAAPSPAVPTTMTAVPAHVAVLPSPAAPPPATLVAAPPTEVAAVPDAGASTVVAEAGDAGTGRHRRRHGRGTALQPDPNNGLTSLGYGGIGHLQNVGAGCGRG